MLAVDIVDDGAIMTQLKSLLWSLCTHTHPILYLVLFEVDDEISRSIR